ncbi:hypothetical protein MNJPNG_06420 [Cupriavidus oxalaticus]|uniref:hypothetical protein n=1 Tax=Cupriavidus oxalaticus TaxID=96344 RepID=UPI003F732414
MDQGDPAVQQLSKQVGEIREDLDRVLAAFPDDDPDGHRRYHDDLKQAAADRRRFYQELALHVAKASTWVALCGVAVTLWNQLLSNLRG